MLLTVNVSKLHIYNYNGNSVMGYSGKQKQMK